MTLILGPCHSDGMFMVSMFTNLDGQQPNPYNFRSGALSVGPDVLQSLVTVVACYGKKKQQTDGQNPAQMTLDWENCQLVPIWLMTLLLKPCHTGGICMVAKQKKYGQSKRH